MDAKYCQIIVLKLLKQSFFPSGNVNYIHGCRDDEAPLMSA